MIFKEFSFRISGIFHAFLCIDVLLATIDTTDETKLEWVDTSSEDIKSVGASIHQIQFR